VGSLSSTQRLALKPFKVIRRCPPPDELRIQLQQSIEARVTGRRHRLKLDSWSAEHTFNRLAKGSRIRPRHEVYSVRPHAIVRCYDRNPELEGLAYGDRIAVVKSRPQKDIALGDKTQCDRMRQVAT
jgi:hypothetical protein